MLLLLIVLPGMSQLHAAAGSAPRQQHMNQTGCEEEEAEDRGSNYLGDKEQKERTNYNKILGGCFSASGVSLSFSHIHHPLRVWHITSGSGNRLGIWQPKGKSLQIPLAT